jgi:MoaA/NifB/PqqE/SkfB family radical SAM enzyme
LFHTTISIDGIGHDQDDLRGAGQWPQTVATWTRLQALRKRYKNLRVSAQMTVSSLNIDTWPAVMARFGPESDTFIVAFGMDNHFYRVQGKLVTIGAKPPGGSPLELGKSDSEAVAAMVRQYPVSGLFGVVEKLFLLGMLRRLRRGSSGVPCVAGDQVIFISAKGEVRPCPFFERSMGSLGDWDYDLRALLETPRAIEVKVAASRCDECWNNCVGLASLAASPAKALRLLSGR